MNEGYADEDMIVRMTRLRLLQRQGRGERIYPDTIREALEDIMRRFPETTEGVDMEKCRDELLRQFSVWTGISATLQDNRDHVSWLTAERKRDWHYWPCHRNWLEFRGRPVSVIDDLDERTDEILGLLEDPGRPGRWDRRGLVVGDVQSGKTGNYAALICKAADAGYRIIIVLAGVHNSLRAQTQKRLEEDFLGFSTDDNDWHAPIGAGLFNDDPSLIPNCGTYRRENGDFSRKNVQGFNVSPEIRPWMFIVKKNKSVLTNLVRWLEGVVATARDPETDRRIIPDLPLLLIDDEADNASVDTAKNAVLDGRANETHDPRQINRLIRRILGIFEKKAYVGYTATPFANIFIHDQAHTASEGDELYPSSFIINLGAPWDYTGPVRVFADEGYGKAIIRHVTDSREWMPHPHQMDHVPLFHGRHDIPDSLRQALHAFILCCAVRQCRGDGTRHCSMLVHVTRLTPVQKRVHDQIRECLRDIQRRLHRNVGSEEILDSLHDLWQTDFFPVMKWFARHHAEDAGTVVSWEEILPVLDDVVQDIRLRCINGMARDTLDYESHKDTGLKVIAVGGDKLSRGLTLEGLSVSYFLRSSRMYDSLMQMGRWFGYRHGYADLCRLYTTEDLCDAYRHVTEATVELRAEFDLMAATGGTPKDYGMKVRTHPTLLVTSPMKMQSAHDIQVTFSGTMPETVTFLTYEKVRQRNLEHLGSFISGLGSPETGPSREQQNSMTRRVWNGWLWQQVPSSSVMEFLEGYESPSEAYRTAPAVLAGFIAGMNEEGELTTWDVYLNNSGQKERTWPLRSGMNVVRALRRREDVSARYSIRRMLGGNEEELLLDGESWRAAMELSERMREKKGVPAGDGSRHPSGPAIREICGFGAPGVPARPDRGLLILYVLDVYEKEQSHVVTENLPLVGFAVSFPGSRRGRTVTYKATSILWREAYGDE